MNYPSLPHIWKHDAYLTRPLMRHVLDIVQRLLKPGMTVVDMGAGTAPYRDLFTSKAAKYICADIAGEKAEIILEPGKPVPMPDGKADLIVSFQVLEHVWDIDWYLSEARRLLHDEGMLILSTHGVWLYHPHPTDYRRWTCEGLVKEIETRGYKVEEFHAMVGPFAWTILFNNLALYALFRKIPFGTLLYKPFAVLFYMMMYFGDAITPSQLKKQNAANYFLIARKVTK